MICLRVLITPLIAMTFAGCLPVEEPSMEIVEEVEKKSEEISRLHSVLKPPSADAAALSIKEPRTSSYQIDTLQREKHTFGKPFDTFSYRLNGKGWGKDGSLSVEAFPSEHVNYFGKRGIAVRVINRTGVTATIHSIDMYLYLTQEALNEKGEWREIERFPAIECNFSFCSLNLLGEEYWQFAAPEYSGAFKTRLRFQLQGWNGLTIYSYEFDGEINPEQFVAR
jgi:hypothetical protein